ncbi:MAG: aminoacetone oxidase family FAD-binding enzyme, partial [Planctomycetota bacterium]
MTEPPRPPPSFDVAVIGAGAAGLMAGYWAARRRRRVILLEGSRACAQKIPISGGGRCNVLPEDVQEGDFFTSGSRNVLRRLLRTWPRLEVERFFLEELSMPLTLERKTRKLFPESESGRAVRDRLVAAASDAGAEIAVRWRVARVDAVKPRGFLIAGPGGERIAASRVIIATGGMSLPKTGSDGAGYRLARALGHSIISPYPALVPLTSDDPGFRELAGVSLPVRWRALLGGRLVDEGARELLFTHRGFSGPAILDASHWAVRDGASIELSWGGQTRGEWLARWRGAERRGPVSLVAAALPRRLAEELCRRAGLTGEHRLGNLIREQ